MTMTKHTGYVTNREEGQAALERLRERVREHTRLHGPYDDDRPEELDPEHERYMEALMRLQPIMTESPDAPRGSPLPACTAP